MVNIRLCFSDARPDLLVSIEQPELTKLQQLLDVKQAGGPLTPGDRVKVWHDSRVWQHVTVSEISSFVGGRPD